MARESGIFSTHTSTDRPRAVYGIVCTWERSKDAWKVGGKGGAVAAISDKQERAWGQAREATDADPGRL